MRLETITLGTRAEIPYLLFKKSLENLKTGKSDIFSLEHRWPKRNMRVCMGKIEFET